VLPPNKKPKNKEKPEKKNKKNKNSCAFSFLLFFSRSQTVKRNSGSVQNVKKIGWGVRFFGFSFWSFSFYSKTFKNDAADSPTPINPDQCGLFEKQTRWNVDVQ
jgi:hypothetical protein